ncbi:hypothetical protein Q0Z83_064750 [Actinoplanes sichuanensis]|uniref:Lasso peptide biosynthesis B2 protein n=1 Tax=Actinoplanes sichuanensis TaxID=512349 RepID=A0ABW4AP98_9ACTN|nr:lasso peptide biosynthesis B2 protein [Actinoplanes sichuanensis]BEL08284.1 hypothetical protein Q0Z83_064750 [Actinoplanes sichuanensis]
MTAPEPGPGRRIVVRTVIVAARVLSGRSPQRIHRVLTRLSRGARPATYREAALARSEVSLVDAYCGGPFGCLPRSIATAMLCRLRGGWPTWHTGPRAHPPFSAHAWVEVDGVAVDEPFPDGFHIPMLTVAAPRA